MPDPGEKGFWASFIDGAMRALSGAFIAAAGALVRDNLDLQSKLKDAKDELAKANEVARRRADLAERDRMRDKYGE